ncbi:MAG: hypothetical protein AB7S38_16605 [Vulcanimicrobiota bacterium]
MRKLLLLTLISFLCGCGGGGGSTTSAENKEAESMAVAEKFGKALASQDLTGAYSMTSSFYQKKVSREAFESEFATATNEYGKPTVVTDTDIGILPMTVEEAASDFDLVTEAPMESWHGWAFATLSSEKGGMDVRMLVIKEGADLKIDHLEYAYPD